MKKLALLAIVFAASACTVVQDPPTKKAAKTPAGTETKPGEAAKPGEEAKPGEATPAGDGVVKSGFVTLSQTQFQAGPTVINSFSVLAGFAETKTTGAGGTAACKTSTEGACIVSECDIPEAQAPADPPAEPVEAAKAPHAGEITVAAAQTLKLAVDDKGAYGVKTGTTELWAAGADINVKAGGDTVPAFEKALKAPGSVTVTKPAWPAAGTALDIDRTKELAFEWTDGADGDVSVALSAITAKKTSSISCKFPSKDNKGTISGAAMGKLIVSDMGSVSVSASSAAAFEQGGWKINLTASAPAKAGASLAAGTAKIK